MYSFNRIPYYNNKSELMGLQVLKFICALLVVQLHIYSILQYSLEPITHVAVPIFFMISGYFMVSSNGTLSSQKIVRIAAKILKITVIAAVAYILFDIAVGAIFNDKLQAAIWEYTDPDYWTYGIIFGSIGAIHLWYLTAYLQALMFIYLLLKIKWLPLPAILFLMIPVGIIINLLIGSYSFMFFDNSFPLVIHRNSLTIGIPCVALGIALRMYEQHFPSQKKIFICLIASIIALCLEHFLFEHNSGAILMLTLPVAVLTFVFFLRLNLSSKPFQILGLWGKQHSLNIYLWHLMVAPAWKFCQELLQLNPGFNAFIVMLLTLVLSITLDPIGLIQKRLRFSKFKSA